MRTQRLLPAIESLPVERLRPHEVACLPQQGCEVAQRCERVWVGGPQCDVAACEGTPIKLLGFLMPP
eukprot:CAMPEP_0180578610 /NCGR_PEP_ID=MMETSP1037_2-20121125/12553_1 /TAXON_ID=632150 /ORGANISM="Azadinium spinosum, Strain 3D9" /LENGTH=66 /DNA_ID=CAMNT_0022596423 /DNA_START=245 /DNA_END=445 /DNA_ORIENTATION=+